MLHIPEDDKTLSVSDKLNWRRRIEEQLWRCVQASGTTHYHVEVMKLEDCVATNFYGLNFMKPIQDNIHMLTEEKPEMILELIKKIPRGPYYDPIVFDDLTRMDRSNTRRLIYHQYWHLRFEFVRDLLAENRGLLFGDENIVFTKQFMSSEHE